MPSENSFVTVFFGALAVVPGAGGIYLDARDHTGGLWGSGAALVVGITLISVAFLAKKPGPARKFLSILGISLIALIVLTFVLALLYLWIRPVH